MNTVANQLLTQFYNWEYRGRGYQVWDVVLDPEPPFIPFPGYTAADFNDEAVDDGREIGLTRRLLNACSGWMKPEQGPQEKEPVEQSARLTEKVELAHLSIVLPHGTTYGPDITEQFLLNLSHCRHRLCFELVGQAGQVTLHLVCSVYDHPTVLAQAQSHFPEASVTISTDRLEDFDPEAEYDWSFAEFGLAHEFMLPLRTYRSFSPDPLNGLIASLGTCGPDETGVVQFIFTPLSYPWASSIHRAITFPNGDPLFESSPDFYRATQTKLSSPLYGAVIRVAGHARNHRRSEAIRRDLAAGLTVADEIGGNELIPLNNDPYDPGDQLFSLTERVSLRAGMILSLDELATFVHLPGGAVTAPGLVREVEHTKAAPAITLERSGVYLGENLHQGESKHVYLPERLRTSHTYVLGATGSGKTTLLASLIRQDILDGRGVGVLDAHGDLIDQVLRYIPESCVDDVVLLDLADDTYPVPFNILSAHTELEKNLLASDLAAAFRRLATSWGDQMTAVLSNGILALLESKRGGTLADLRRFLVEKKFRDEYLKSVEDDEVVYYWKHEFGLLSGKPQGSVVTRLNTFLRPKPIRYMIAHGENRLNVGQIMNQGKIFLARLPQGAIGEENAYLLGTLLVSAFHRSALCRQETEATKRAAFMLYIDEFHNFVTPSMAQILSGARKYGLGLVLAHQELRQLESRDPDVASAVITNPATQVCFRLGDQDARRMESGLSGFDAHDLQNLSVGKAVCRVERADWDFNLSVPQLLPPEGSDEEVKKKVDRIRQRCRERYGVPRAEVEAKLKRSRPGFEDIKESASSHAPDSAKVPLPEAPKPDPMKRPTPAPQPVAETASRGRVETKPDLEPQPRESPKQTPQAPPTRPQPTQGRGGLKHKSLQRLIKHWAEGMGYQAQIEKPVLDGRGAVDVALAKGEVTIGCEISITTPTLHECQNISKCLQAGFTHVAVITDDKNHLDAIRQKTQSNLNDTEFERLHFLLPKQLFGFIEELEEESIKENQKTIRGYRVKVNRTSFDPQSQASRIKSVSRTIAKASLRQDRHK